MTKKIQILILVSILTIVLPARNSFAGFSFFTKKDRPYIYITGSSTISPLMASISEEFSRNDKDIRANPDKSPIVESTGTSEGFRQFCLGVGGKYPDLVNASRQITKMEIFNCEKNGINDIIEIKIGYDGIVFGNSIKNKKTRFKREHIFLALAEKIFDKRSQKIINNPYKKWSEIDSDLPNVDILVYGPPIGSGTRDIFAEILLEEFCLNDEKFILKYSDKQDRKNQCHKIRNDGKYVSLGENDQVIIQHLKDEPNSFGIFGFNFLMANRNKIQASLIDNVEPNFENISYKRYKLVRPLFVYFKRQNLDLMPKMRDFIQEVISEETIGKKGYLFHSGLIPLGDDELVKIRKYILMQLSISTKKDYGD